MMEFPQQYKMPSSITSSVFHVSSWSMYWLLRQSWLRPPIETLWYRTTKHFWEDWKSYSCVRERLACSGICQTKESVWYLDKSIYVIIFRLHIIESGFQTWLSLTWITNWLHHKITWCSMDNQTFFMLVLLIIKPWVGGTMPSRDSYLVLTWKQKQE